VIGEFMEGNKSLQRNEGGLWSVTLGPIEPEIYYYNFTIDGVRTIDPNNPNVKTGSTPSTISSILDVIGPASTMANPFRMARFEPTGIIPSRSDPYGV
jgi:hypothetical protein